MYTFSVFYSLLVLYTGGGILIFCGLPVLCLDGVVVSVFIKGHCPWPKLNKKVEANKLCPIWNTTCFRNPLHASDVLMALFLSTDAEEIATRRWSEFFCPLWVFLRSGLAVPKAVARKPLPQKVSALDSGIWTRRRLSSTLMEQWVSLISVGGSEWGHYSFVASFKIINVVKGSVNVRCGF